MGKSIILTEEQEQQIISYKEKKTE